MLSNRKNATFKGGIHPSEFKYYTENLPIEDLPLPKKVIIPMSQHIGAPCKPIVNKGDDVLVGQKIGEATSFISSPVHASVAGKVIAVEESSHPLGSKVTSVTIMVAPEQEVSPDLKAGSLDALNPEEIKELIKESGIVGLGGATFPTSVKLSPPEGKDIDTVLVNGCECEPFLTADHRLMLEKAEDLILGCKAIQKAMGIKKVVIGIEKNKQDAIDTLVDLTANDSDIVIQPLVIKYPQGAEKMLIDAALGRKVAPGTLPMEVGVVVINVGTAVAVSDAVVTGSPLIQRVVTVSGDGINQPKNLRVKVGTLFSDLVDYCGGLKEDVAKIIMGGPMMGFAQADLNVPVIKGTSGIICLSKVLKKQYNYHPCIKCGKCVSVCPINLIPSKLGMVVEKKRYELLEENNIMDCMECGCCVYVCPAKRPMVQWVKVGKNKFRELNSKK